MWKLEQRANIKFCFKLNKSATETHQMLRQAYGDTAVTHKTVCKWLGRFKEGKESLDDDDRSGRPSTSRNDDNIAAVKTIIRSNRRLTIREISEETNLSFGSVQAILTDDLNMRRVAAKFVPRILTAEQKESRFAISSELFERSVADAAFLSSIVTGDESWVYGYDPETKVQSSQWKTPSSPAPKKARMSKSLVKVMLIAFFDMEGLLHIEFVPRGCAVNAIFYVEVLKRLRESIRRKRPEKWRNGWLLHHDNAPSHTSLLVQEFMAGKNIAAVPHPPYSPDLAPCDFWLFPKIKSTMKGNRFDTIEDIKSNTTKQIKLLKKEDFQECFQKWQARWSKCVCAEGKYFEPSPDTLKMMQENIKVLVIGEEEFVFSFIFSFPLCIFIGWSQASNVLCIRTRPRQYMEFILLLSVNPPPLQF